MVTQFSVLTNFIYNKSIWKALHMQETQLLCLLRLRQYQSKKQAMNLCGKTTPIKIWDTEAVSHIRMLISSFFSHPVSFEHLYEWCMANNIHLVVQRLHLELQLHLDLESSNKKQPCICMDSWQYVFKYNTPNKDILFSSQICIHVARRDLFIVNRQ